MPRIAVVADSTAGMSSVYAAEYNVEIVPLSSIYRVRACEMASISMPSGSMSCCQTARHCPPHRNPQRAISSRCTIASLRRGMMASSRCISRRASAALVRRPNWLRAT